MGVRGLDEVVWVDVLGDRGRDWRERRRILIVMRLLFVCRLSGDFRMFWYRRMRGKAFGDGMEDRLGKIVGDVMARYISHFFP